MTESFHGKGTTSAHDVARELRRRLPGLGVVKLHKLLYYAQGWHLAWCGEALFGEPVEAWSNGPVVAKLWADEKYDRPTAEPRPLTDRQRATIDYVVERYGTFTGKDLVRLTHAEAPWRTISESDDPRTGADAEVTPDAMRAWFTSDEEFVARSAEVAKLRERRDVYSFGSLGQTAGLDEAISRSVAGRRVRDERPG